MEQAEVQFKRSIAYKIFLSDVADLPFVKGDGTTTSNYLENGPMQISRVNVIGTIVQKQGNTIIAIEDNTSQMQLRVFEDNGLFQRVEIGDVALVIGRPREYGTERYILPEMVKKVDAAWLMMRSKEISVLSKANANDAKVPSAKIISHQQNSIQNEEKNNVEVLEKEEIRETPSETILAYIKSNDRGEGVDIQEIIEARVVDGVEKLISMLLRNGDVFEIRPGRVKVLE